MNYKIRAMVSFKDGNILPNPVKYGEVIEVDERTYKRIVASGGKFEVLARTVPAPEKSKNVK